MGKPQALQLAVLQVALHGVELRHRVGHRRARGEHRAASAGLLVEDAALHEQVGRLHGLALGDAADVSHLGVEEQVLVVVGLVHEDPVDAELLEREHVVLVGLVSELGESHVQALLRDLHLLHAEPFAVLRLDLGYAVGELGDLALYERSLTLHRYGYLLELGVPHDHAVPVPRGDAGAEAPAVAPLEVALGGHQQIGGGVEPQPFRRPLPREVVRHDEQGLGAKPYAPQFHGGRRHGECLARSHLVGEKRVFPVEDAGDGVSLVRPQLYLGVHAGKRQVRAVELARADGVEPLVVGGDQPLPARLV